MQKPATQGNTAKLLTIFGIACGIAVGCASGSEPGSESGQESLGSVRQQLVTSGPVVELQPGAEGIDARVFSRPDVADSNYGGLTRFEAVAWSWDGAAAAIRSFFDFDLSNVPAGSTARRATLILQADTSLPPPLSGHSTLSGPNDFRIEPVIAPWQEGTITWNNQPATDPTKAVTAPASTRNDQTYEIDVTALIKDELSAPDLHHGFMLRLQNEQAYRAVQFASSDHPDPAKRPKLVIEYARASRTTGSECSIDFIASHAGLTANFSGYMGVGNDYGDFTWTFGDGTSEVRHPLDTVHHTYTKDGAYEVCVSTTATNPETGDPCAPKTCHSIDTLSVSGACCDRNDKAAEREVEYAPGHFANFVFKLQNVGGGTSNFHGLTAEVNTYTKDGLFKKAEKVDHLYVDIIADVRELDDGVECSTTSTHIDDFDNNNNESRLELRYLLNGTYGLGAGDGKAYFSVRLGSTTYRHELSLAQCKKDGEACSRDTACGSGKCGGCLSMELGWCYTPHSGAYGAECKADEQCKSERCSADCYLNPTGKCLCKFDSDCAADEYCGWGLNSGKCVKKKSDNEACAANGECQSGECGGCLNAVGWCYTPGSADYNEECRSDKQCSTGRCSADCYLDTHGVCLCNGNSDCAATQYCGSGLNSGKCLDKKANGDACSAHDQCQSGACGGIIKGLGHCFQPHSKEIGQGCRADGECKTDRCVNTRLVCGCTEDGQCGGDQFCNKLTGECKGKKGKGGTCSRGAMCQSGKCRDIGLCKG